MSEILQIQNLATGYEKRVLLKDFDVSFQTGSMYCLLGPNGCGKSTLLRTLAGLQNPISGQVLVGGESVHTMEARKRADKIAVVLSGVPDLRGMTGEEVAALGALPRTGFLGRLSAEDNKRVGTCLQKAGADHLAERLFETMSDGEKQRVLIARALVQNPKLLILDEPTAFLDLPHRVQILHLLRDIARTEQCVVLLSTHDLYMALNAADYILLLQPQGEYCLGIPEELLLDGELEKSFPAEGLRFDPWSASFFREDESLGEVWVEGNCLHSSWACRAFERIGFTFNVNAPIRIHYSEGVWNIKNGAESKSMERLADAMSWVQSLMPKL